jgi:LytS/YehU family sensor histidine kinase
MSNTLFNIMERTVNYAKELINIDSRSKILKIREFVYTLEAEGCDENHVILAHGYLVDKLLTTKYT